MYRDARTPASRSNCKPGIVGLSASASWQITSRRLRVRLPPAGPAGPRCAACAPGARSASRALTVIVGTPASSVSEAGPGLRSSAATGSARSPASRSASISAVTVWPAPTVQPSTTTSRGRSSGSTARDRASLTWSGRPGPRPPDTTVTWPRQPALRCSPGPLSASSTGAGRGRTGAVGGGPAADPCPGTVVTGARGRGSVGREAGACGASAGAADDCCSAGRGAGGSVGQPVPARSLGPESRTGPPGRAPAPVM